MNELALRATMCEVGRRLWQRGLIGATEGNITCRLGEGRFLSTPSGVSKGHLRPDELVVVDRVGKAIKGGTPSSELALHLCVYEWRPDCQAVVHAHPPIATGFALAGEAISDNLLPEAAVVLGSVANVPFAMPGTGEAAQTIGPLLADHKTFLISHHGALTLGRDLLDAAARMETLERVAHVIFVARQLGGARPMPNDAFQTLLQTALDGKL
jgi:L-fuculose-phosphate aldolase